MNENKRVLLCGVGRMGIAISWCMDQFGFHVIGVDKDIKSAANLPKPVDFLLVENDEDIRKAIDLANPDIVISSLPYHQTADVAFLCIRKGIAYCDLGGRVDVSRSINDYANGKATKPVFTDLGLAPGWVNIIAEHGCNQFEKGEVDEVKMMVGGLPINPTNPPFNYEITWSVDGLVNEYKDNCSVILGGRRDIAPGMDGLEDVYCKSINKELEAFYTSGGASHSLESMLDRGVENCSYKTLRFKGHNQLIKLLIKNSGLSDDCLKEVFEKVCLAKGVNDMVIIKCSVKTKSSELWEKELLIPHGAHFTAMQKATSFAISSVAKQMAEGVVTGKNLKYKDVDYENFQENIHILRMKSIDNPYEI